MKGGPAMQSLVEQSLLITKGAAELRISYQRNPTRAPPFTVWFTTRQTARGTS